MLRLRWPHVSQLPPLKPPTLQSHPIGPFTPCVFQGVIGPRLNGSYPMMTAMRQLGRPLGESSKSAMSEIRTYGTTGISRRRTRPTRPPGRSGPMDRTAGGIGGAAPASLDLYGQSRTDSICDCTSQTPGFPENSRLIKFSIVFPANEVFVKIWTDANLSRLKRNLVAPN